MHFNRQAKIVTTFVSSAVIFYAEIEKLSTIKQVISDTLVWWALLIDLLALREFVYDMHMAKNVEISFNEVL